MGTFKCKMCGGTIEFSQGDTVGVCDSCGSKQTLPRLDDDRRANLYDRANHFRRNNDFDKAAGIYEQILNEDPTDAEAYWSLVLCKYGIEYVEDPATKKRVPTVNRAQFTAVFDDENYRSALKYADGFQKALYEEEANTINEIQKGILAISKKETPFDVFICYKETDADGRRTPDSVLANDLYHQLTQEGFKVFFSRITLEDKLGTAYEPYIFAAINSAKVMVVLGTKQEHFNSVWVKNEWSRFLGLVKKSGGSKTLVPAYRDMNPYDLPEEFSHLQAQDMSKLGFMQDLIRGIKKIIGTAEPLAKNSSAEPMVVSSVNDNRIGPFLKEAFKCLKEEHWKEADKYCERIIDIDPENAWAYLGKLLAEYHVQKPSDLANCNARFYENSNYIKALRFSDESLFSQLNNYRIMRKYDEAVGFESIAKNEDGFKSVAEMFIGLSGFRDADKHAESCLKQADECRKTEIYARAREQMEKRTVDGYESAIQIFESIKGWADSAEQILDCQDAIRKEKAEEAKRKKKRRIIKKTLKAIPIVGVFMIICVVLGVIVIPMISPEAKCFVDYQKAVLYLKNEKYEKATSILNELAKEGYKDSIYLFQMASIEEATVGDYVWLGTYEQDNDEYNGKEMIEWIVADYDTTGQKKLLVSRYVIDIVQFNLTMKGNRWSNSYIKEWLNGEFANGAFDKKMLELIVEENGKVFLLEGREASYYLYDKDSYAGIPTEYSLSKIIETSGEYLKGGIGAKDSVCAYWTRTPCDGKDLYVMAVNANVERPTYGYIVTDRNIGVRPAIWVSTKLIDEKLK